MLAIVGVMIRSLREIPGPVVVFYHAIGGLAVTSLFMMWEAHNNEEYYTKLIHFNVEEYLVASLGALFYAGAFIGSNMAF